MKQAIFKQIQNITKVLLQGSLQIDYQSAIKTGISDNEITWAGSKNIAFSLKDEAYTEIYKEMNKERDYNFKMFDQAIVQMKYRFYKNDLVEHILAYYPNPDVEGFKDNPNYDEDYYGNKLFSDIIDKKIIIFPIRFDYTQDFTDCEHPKVHATFGNHTTCRIPVLAPISPNRFILFILRTFYFEKFKETFIEQIPTELQIVIDKIYSDKKRDKIQQEKEVLKIKNEFLNNIFACSLKFDKTISSSEENMLHFNFKI